MRIYLVTHNHELTEGHYCGNCAPEQDTSNCGYCQCDNELPMSDEGHYICTEVVECDDAHDYPDHCTTCGVFLDVPLSNEGTEYAMSAIESWLRFVEAYGYGDNHSSRAEHDSIMLQWIDAYGLPDGWSEDTVPDCEDYSGRQRTFSQDADTDD